MTQPHATSPDLLETIVAAARRILEVRKATVPEDVLEKKARDRRPSAGQFVRALRDGPSPRVIAECKRRPPSRGILRADYRPAEHAAAYAKALLEAEGVRFKPDGGVDLRRHLWHPPAPGVEASGAGADGAALGAPEQ